MVGTPLDDEEIIELKIPLELAGLRLDQAVAKAIPEYSRARLQQWIKEGRLQVNGQSSPAKAKVYGGELISLAPVLEDQDDWQAENIPLDIVFEDEALIVINKPAGLVVHPAAGNRSGTVLNALLHHAPELSKIPRAGIVHRLDKDTTGLMVVAKTLQAQKALVEQLQARSVSREYVAVVHGVFVSGGTIDAPIGRHPQDRKKMAVREGGKEAITHYRIQEKLANFTVVNVKLETGRTHQIRVHMAHQRHPLIGDSVYGGRLRLPKGASDVLIEVLRGFSRQALHAQRLSLSHPSTEEMMGWSAELPQDMQTLINVLQQEDHDA